jgi:penicillin-binding protein 2
MDPRNGEILAMVSKPSPDPNLFAVRIKPEDWKALNEDPNHPLLHRAIQAQLAPGSVFKVILATAALETKALRPGFTINCSGSATFYGRKFQCWKQHGVVDLHRAIVESCDVFFYNVGKILGIERIAYYARQFGLGQPTGIDLPGEEAGLIPSPEWKMRRFKQQWWAGETISVAIGQGAVQVTPLQLARTIAGLASGGNFPRPHLLKDNGNETYKQVGETADRFPLQESTVETVTMGMWGVVNENGTAAASRIQGVEFCGKTGTAQLISQEGRKKAQGRTQRNLVHNAWFIGYAPRRNPEIVVSVLVEHGEHGSMAGTLARDVIRSYYDKKARQVGSDYRVELRRIRELESPFSRRSGELPSAMPLGLKPDSP